jgi:hypothetical protein
MSETTSKKGNFPYNLKREHMSSYKNDIYHHPFNYSEFDATRLFVWQVELWLWAQLDERNVTKSYSWNSTVCLRSRVMTMSTTRWDKCNKKLLLKQNLSIIRCNEKLLLEQNLSSSHVMKSYYSSKKFVIITCNEKLLLEQKNCHHHNHLTKKRRL